MAKILNLPDEKEWKYTGVDQCSVTVRDNKKPLTIADINWLLDAAKHSLIRTSQDIV